jgi:hypothetical protein
MGESCIFVARGWVVDVQSIERFSKRAKLRESQPEDDDEQHLPADLRCIPLPQTVAKLDAPTDFETLRKLFHHTSVLFHSFFDRDFTSMVRRDYTMLDAAYEFMLDAMTAFQAHDYSRGGPLLDSSFALLEDIVSSNHPNGLSVVLKTVAACYKQGFAEIAEKVATYARDMAGVRLDERDPRWMLYNMLPTLRVFDLDTRAEGGLVGVYEVLCRDLWRKERPSSGVLLLCWYPGLFRW